MKNFHYLKCNSFHYSEIVDLTKTFELRKDDRDWACGDYLILKEIKDQKETGRQCLVEITHILHRYEGLDNGWCILAIKFLATAEYPIK